MARLARSLGRATTVACLLAAQVGPLAPLALVSSMSSEALAQPAPDAPAATDPAAALAAVQAARRRLDYKSVRKLARAALAIPGNSRVALIELYRHLGTSEAVLGDEPAALDAFTRLLALDPDHRLPPGLPPRVVSPFREAGGFWIDRPKGLTVTPQAPQVVTAGDDLRVPVVLDDPLQMAATVRLHYRLRGAATFASIDAPAAPPPTLVVPSSQLDAGAADGVLEYYATAYDVNQGELTGAGTAANPLTLVIKARVLITTVPEGVVTEPVVPPPTRTARDDAAGAPIYKKWWFWTAIGVVAVGAGGTLLWYETRDTGVDLEVTAR